jgi:hypothetical protein
VAKLEALLSWLNCKAGDWFVKHSDVKLACGGCETALLRPVDHSRSWQALPKIEEQIVDVSWVLPLVNHDMTVQLEGQLMVFDSKRSNKAWGQAADSDGPSSLERERQCPHFSNVVNVIKSKSEVGPLL